MSLWVLRNGRLGAWPGAQTAGPMRLSVTKPKRVCKGFQILIETLNTLGRFQGDPPKLLIPSFLTQVCLLSKNTWWTFEKCGREHISLASILPRPNGSSPCLLLPNNGPCQKMPYSTKKQKYTLQHVSQLKKKKGTPLFKKKNSLRK